MFRRRLQRAALLVLTLLVVTVGARLAEAVETTSVQPADDVLFDESFAVRPGERLTVDLGSEAVTVRSVRGDRARVRVEGEGRDAAEAFERRRFTARTTRDGLEVRTQPRRRWLSFWGTTDARLAVVIEVPRRFDVTVDVGSGAVSVGELDGDLSVDTGSGAVRVADHRGDVHVDTGSGAVRLGDVDGRLVVDTGSGAVAAGSVTGPVEIDTGSGAVSVTVLGRESVAIDTGSGGVSVTVPRRSGWDLELEGGLVEIDDALAFRGTRGRREAEGRLGDGGPRLEVDTGSGRIRIGTR